MQVKSCPPLAGVGGGNMTIVFEVQFVFSNLHCLSDRKKT